MESNSEDALKQVMKENYSSSTSYEYKPRFYHRVWVRRIFVFVLLLVLIYLLYFWISGSGNV